MVKTQKSFQKKSAFALSQKPHFEKLGIFHPELNFSTNCKKFKLLSDIVIEIPRKIENEMKIIDNNDFMNSTNIKI